MVGDTYISSLYHTESILKLITMKELVTITLCAFIAIVSSHGNYLYMFVKSFLKLNFLIDNLSAVQNKRTVNCISIETEKIAKNFFLLKNVHFCKVAQVPKYFPRKSFPESLTVTYSQACPKFVLTDVFFLNTIFNSVGLFVFCVAVIKN